MFTSSKNLPMFSTIEVFLVPPVVMEFAVLLADAEAAAVAPVPDLSDIKKMIREAAAKALSSARPSTRERWILKNACKAYNPLP